jgi:hypothetical protein
LARTITLADLKPLILKAAKQIERRGTIPAGGYAYRIDENRLILVDIEVVHTSWGKGFNALVTIGDLPFRFGKHRGTLKLLLNILDVLEPRACGISLESVTCSTGNPRTLNRTKLQSKLHEEWAQ